MTRDSHDILTDPPPPAAGARVAYGSGPLQFGDLRVPAGAGPFPLAVLFHGGYWQSTYNLIHTGHMCIALAEEGIATWNLEYRRVGDPGGEWPAAGEDVGLALSQLEQLPFEHDGRTVLVGHSAGGHSRCGLGRGPVWLLSHSRRSRTFVTPPSAAAPRARPRASWRRCTTPMARRSSSSHSGCRRS